MSERINRTREVVRLADLVVATPRIDNTRFEDCLILGPAVLATTGNGSIVGCSFDADPTSILWPIEPPRSFVVGAIEAADCDFVRCRFSMVGFAGNPAFIEMFMKGAQ